MKQVYSPYMSRRKFIATGAKSFAAISLVPGLSISGLGQQSVNNKLNIAGIGVGGIGKVNLTHMRSENIVALCDVDWSYAAEVFNQYPEAKRYKDYRVMFDEMDQSIDAVMIATPDHTHFVIAVEAMKRGKHVFLQKPMGHSIYEVRELVRLAKETKVATQLGNQANSGEGIRSAAEWIWDGAIGHVTEVEAWSNRPLWHQGIGYPTGDQAIPDTMDWDVFLGPAKERPYNRAYTPYNWRAFWDFGTGALGDMVGHMLDMPFLALQLGIPDSVSASTSNITTASYPQSSIVNFNFPARKIGPEGWLPAVSLRWYDGGLTPELPKSLGLGQQMGESEGGVILKGTKGMLMTTCFGCEPVLLPEGLNQDYIRPEKVLRRINQPLNGGHEQDWIRACKEDPEGRVECSSNFRAAAEYTESALLGNIAIRLQGLGKRLFWDKQKMRFSNLENGEMLQIDHIDFQTAYNNFPHIEKNKKSFDALELASEMIKHSYRDGWIPSWG